MKDASKQVYRLGNNRTLCVNICRVYQPLYKSTTRMKEFTRKYYLSDSIMCSKMYLNELMAIKDFMHNGRNLDNLGAITNNKFKNQLQII